MTHLPSIPKHHLLLLSIVVGVIGGVLTGTYFPELGVRCGVFGTLFLNALKMIVLPLIITSMIVGITNIGALDRLGGVGLKTVLYYILTTAIAVIIGIILVDVMKPGVGFGGFAGDLPEKVKSVKDLGATDILLSVVHPNLVVAAGEFKILPIIFISILFGISFSLLGEKAKPLIDVFNILNDAIMQMVHWIMVFTPLGIFGLIAARLGEAGGGEAFFSLMNHLGKYSGTVILGLLIHGCVALPLTLFLITKRNPFRYFIHFSKALLTAFATASSSATLPVTMECAKEEAKVSERSTDFVLPLGATVNMDGTALYEAIAAIFIAQSYGIALAMGQKVIIFLTATLAAIGAAGIPEAGLVTMVLVLQSVGLPTEGIGLILAIDWFLDRCRTTVNVWGDAVGAAVVDKLEPSS